MSRSMQRIIPTATSPSQTLTYQNAGLETSGSPTISLLSSTRSLLGQGTVWERSRLYYSSYSPFFSGSSC